MAAPAHQAFLSTRNDARGIISEQTLQALPMCGSVTEVTTQWYYARVSVRTEFRNPSAQVVKTFGCFDTAQRVGGHLASLRAEVGKQFLQARVAECIVEPKTTAAQQPQTAFTFDVPWLVHGGASVVVTAVFMIPLAVVGANQARFVLPKELVPKAPAAAPGADDDAPAGEAWASKFGIKSEPRLPATVLVHGRGAYFAAVDGTAKASLPGAAVTRLGDPRRFELRYENRDVIDQLPKDFEVVATLIPDEDPIVIQAVKEDAPFVADKHRYALAIAAAPKLSEAAGKEPNVELSILCDCSGSMAPYAGPVKNAVRGLAASLPGSVFANVMRFGDTQEWALHESAQLHDQEPADAIATFPLSADMGSTKLYQAFGDAYVKPVVQGHARVMVVVSDGAEEKHTQRLLELAAANAHTTRIVAVTLGKHADVALFAMLAKVTNGTHVHCDDAATLPEVLAAAVDPLLVPHLTGTQVTFAYDGSDEQPPLQLTTDHPAMIAAGTKAVFYAFGASSLRGCTVKVSGLVGSEYREMKSYTGAPDQFEVNSATEHDVSTVSLVHAAAAAGRLDSLVNMNAKSAPSVDERHEVIALSLAFAVPSPYTKLQCRSGEKDADVFDAKARIVSAPFTERRAWYALPAPSRPRGPNGLAVDPDVAGLAAVAASPERRCPEGATAKAYLRTVVEDCVADVVAPSCIDDVIQRQQRGGFWTAARAFPVLDYCGLSYARVVDAMPEGLVPVRKMSSPAPAAAAAAAAQSSSKRASAAATPSDSDAIPSVADAPAAAAATPASPAAASPAPADQAKKPAAATPASPVAASPAPEGKKGAAAAAAAAPASPVAAEPELPAAPTPEAMPAAPPTPPPKEPTPPPYNGAHPEDLWVTAVAAAALKAASATAAAVRVKWTLARANAFIDEAGAAGATARTAAEAYVKNAAAAASATA